MTSLLSEAGGLRKSMALSLNCKGEHNPIYRENSISQSQQGKDRSVVCARREISRLLLLCDERQMPAENGGYPPTQNGDIRSLFWLFSLMALQN